MLKHKISFIPGESVRYTSLWCKSARLNCARAGLCTRGDLALSDCSLHFCQEDRAFVYFALRNNLDISNLDVESQFFQIIWLERRRRRSSQRRKSGTNLYLAEVVLFLLTRIPKA